MLEAHPGANRGGTPGGYTAMALYLGWSALDVNTSDSCSVPGAEPAAGVQLKNGVQAASGPTCSSVSARLTVN
jgi:hypothetical protein